MCLVYYRLKPELLYTAGLVTVAGKYAVLNAPLRTTTAIVKVQNGGKRDTLISNTITDCIGILGLKQEA